MKRALLILSISSLSIMAGARDWYVDTTPTVRGILLEEFTGIHCGYCPQGHVIANAMHTARPSQVSVIAMHAGSYAVPHGTEPDLRSDDGNAIHDCYINGYGYPSGMVNRTDFNDTDYAVCSRDVWTSYARSISTQNASVNLWASAVYDNSERTLAIEVEGALASTSVSTEGMRLNVAITQDNILGPQNGAYDGDSYKHRHVLRDYVSDPFGDPVAQWDEEGRFFTSYIVDIPTDYQSVAVDPRELQVVVFITLDDGTVDNAVTVTPSFLNYQPRAAYELSDFKVAADGDSYGYRFFDVNLRNISTSTVESAAFTIEANGASEQVNIADMSISPMATATIRIPASEIIPGTFDGACTISLDAINGAEASATPLSLNINKVTAVPTHVKITIRTDNFADDNTWALNDADGNAVAVFGPFENSEVTEYSEEMDLDDGSTYCLEITDNWGDGLLDPRGMVKVHDSEGNLLAQSLRIEGHGLRIFFTADKALDPAGTTLLSANPSAAPTRWYSVDGRFLGTDRSALPRGIAIGRSGSEVVKIIVP